MCDYSLHNVASRPARVGDKLTTRDFGTGTRGFAASESARVAVCVLPGTELAFANPVECRTAGLLGWGRKVTGHRTAIFRQINKERPAAHHDTLEFPDRQFILLTDLVEGQEAVVLQLPARPTTAGKQSPRNAPFTLVEHQRERNNVMVGRRARRLRRLRRRRPARCCDLHADHHRKAQRCRPADLAR